MTEQLQRIYDKSIVQIAITAGLVLPPWTEKCEEKKLARFREGLRICGKKSSV